MTDTTPATPCRCGHDKARHLTDTCQTCDGPDGPMTGSCDGWTPATPDEAATPEGFMDALMEQYRALYESPVTEDLAHPAMPDEAVEPNGGPIEAFALALDIDSWAEAVDLSERSVPNLRSIGWELRRFDDGMDWRSAYLHLLESWAAVCEMTGIESDSSPEEVVEALSRQQGDTVAARAESPEDIEARVGKMLVEAATLRTIRANGLDDIHEIRHIGAALTWGNTSDCDPADCKLDRAGGWDREKLLGIVADGAGDGR